MGGAVQQFEVNVQAEEATRRLGVILAHVLVREEPVAVTVLGEDGMRRTYLVKAEFVPPRSEAQLELLEGGRGNA